jgi:hypothetical protein
MITVMSSAEVSLRFTGNKPPLPNCATVTLDEFYYTHSHPNHVSWYLDACNVPAPFKPLSKNAKIPLMCIEIYIDTNAVCLILTTLLHSLK